MAVGSVYYFNATPNAMLLLNNNAILNQSLAGVSQSSSYAPSANQVARNSGQTSGNKTFGTTNTLVVSFPDGTSQTYPVNIDPNKITIDQDVQLYIFFNEVVLVDPTGTGTQSVIQGSAVSAAEVEALVTAAGG